QEHLDRCLSCRNCETTCPSGVEYHNLLDIGRALVDAAVQRPLAQRMLRQGLRKLVPNPGLFKGLIGSGQVFRALLPGGLESKLPRSPEPAKQRPTARHARKMLILEGCVQSSLSPNTNAAAVRVLDQLKISV
ncbi:glycolate oxidase subunit GlcF, partial [Pseudomonas gingeri]|nr:glycolate oxidase subunit GlcF [Pseudomonas gingeri]